MQDQLDRVVHSRAARFFLSSITDISHFFCVDGTTNNLRAQGASYLIEKVANMVVAESL